ncbi:MAG: hypothetical protein RBU27_10660 [Bacteroidota bacterium]|jgi:hypothetical protein|nr:hypothetical protein [Bacteroidota bacterium]
MQRILTLLLLLLLTVPALMAQEEDEDFEIRPNRKPHGGGIVGGGGGITPTWHVLNTADLNTALAGKGLPALDEGGAFLFGGQGYAYIMLIPNLRVGGIGYGGSLESRRDEAGRYQATSLDISAGGVLLEYVIPFGRFHVAIGGMLGSGAYTLTLTQSDNTGKNWDGLFPSTPVSAVDTRHELKSSFLTWQPALTLEYELHPFVLLGVTGGWFGGSGEWEMDDRFPVAEMPDFGFESPFLRVGLTFGLFLGES